MKVSTLICSSLSLALFGASLASTATSSRQPAASNSQLPSFECGPAKCTFDYSRAANDRASLAAAPTPANTTPVAVAPPSGQRLLWQGGGYPACQSMITNPVPSYSDPYSYILAEDVPVPLGTTHTSLLANLQTRLSGGPSGAGGVVAILQIKRSNSANWFNVTTGYVNSAYGMAEPQALYDTTSFMGLVDLASLSGGTDVPGSIDARVVVFPVYTTAFLPTYSDVCKGQMQITF